MNRTALKQRISTRRIAQLKEDAKAFECFIRKESESSLVYVLEKFGRIENKNCQEVLLKLRTHTNANVRVLAIKNLAKIADINFLNIFAEVARNDSSTAVQCEAISAIGRQRAEMGIPILEQFLQNSDPKIILQAIRGLFVFKHRAEIRNLLAPLQNHPNELICEIVQKEFVEQKKDTAASFPHDTFPKKLTNLVVKGDTQQIMRHIPDDSIHLTFTSPPYYNARDYSIYHSYKEYLDFLRVVFSEVHRITKEGRFFVLNTSPVLVPRISRAHSSKRYPIPFDIHPILTNMGWEFIDDIVWAKPEVTVKNRNAGFLQHRKPLGYKPNPVTEMLMVYRKKTDKLIDWNMRQYNQDKIHRSKVVGEYETSNIWKIDPSFDRVHSAVFPLELCNRVIKFYSFVEDIVFDPFGGSGTLAEAALLLDRYFFLTEKEDSYIQRIKERLNSHANMFGECARFVEFNSDSKATANR